ncbi:MAG: hypothetical protein ABR585_11470 [Gemmatimonadaceae bacterium]
MTKAWVPALAGLLVCSTACRKSPEARAAELRSVETSRQQAFARRLTTAPLPLTAKDARPIALWVIPNELREISGLTLLANDHVLVHDDEVGKVYEIDPKTGIILKGFTLAGDVHGDFESITTAGQDIYLLASDGKLFKFRDAPDGAEVPYTKYDTQLGEACEFESMAFEADSSRLLLACKKVHNKSLKHHLVIYRLPLPITDATKPSLLTIPIAEVIGSNKWKNFEPSDMAIDPITKNYVLIASHANGLAVITPGGKVLRSEPLPPGHFQPEGLAITRDSIMILSDEATHIPADIALYRWRP